MKQRTLAQSKFIKSPIYRNVEVSPPEQLPYHPKTNRLADRPMGLSGLLSAIRPANMADTPSSVDNKRYRDGGGQAHHCDCAATMRRCKSQRSPAYYHKLM